MSNLILNNKLKPKTWFIVLCICFCLYILLFSFLYPFTADEIRGFTSSLLESWNEIKYNFLQDAPRFMNLPLVIILYLGPIFAKTFFCIVNPLMQIGIVYGLFYVIKGRKLNIDSWQDFFPFLLICLIYLLMTPSPSNTLFWIAGTFNYSWAFLFCIYILCLYRKGLKQEFIKDTFLVKVLSLFSSFVAGMSNENTGPMMLGVSLCFIIWSKYKKVKLPQYIYYAFIGVLLGVGAMFGLGGSSARLNSTDIYAFFVNSSLQNKLFLSIGHFNNFASALYYLPILLPILFILLVYDKGIKTLKEQEFILSIFLWGCSFILAFVLFAAPLVADRAYYSAGIFCIISFLIYIDIITQKYKIYFVKYLTLIILICNIILFPLIAIPYFALYRDYNARERVIYALKETGQKEIKVESLLVLLGPTDNLSIQYMDFAKLEFFKWYGVEIKNISKDFF